MKVYVLLALFGLAFSLTPEDIDDEYPSQEFCDDFFLAVATKLGEPLPTDVLPYHIFACMPPPLLHFAIGLTDVLEAYKDDLTRPETLCIAELVRHNLLHVIMERHANQTAARERSSAARGGRGPGPVGMPSHCPMPEAMSVPIHTTDVMTCLGAIPNLAPINIDVDLVKNKLDFLRSLTMPELCMIKMVHATIKLAHRIRHAVHQNIGHVVDPSTNDIVDTPTVLEKFFTALVLQLLPAEDLAAIGIADHVPEPEKVSALACFAKLLEEKIDDITDGECALPPPPFCHRPNRPNAPPTVGGKRPKPSKKSFDANKKTLKENIKLYLGL